MKKLLKQSLSLLLALVLAAPVYGGYGLRAFAQSEGTENVTEAAAQVSADDTEAAEEGTGLTIQDDLHNQYGAVLYKENLLSSDAEGVSFAYDQESDSVVISGKKKNIVGNRIRIGKEYDFSGDIIGRFSIDMSAPKRNVVTVGFYLDDETEPFFTTNLVRQKKDDSWTYSKNISKDVYDKKITGTHTVSFAVLENDKTPDSVSFSLKSFEFVKSSVPVVYFDIDEEDGTIEAMNNDGEHNTQCYGDMSIRIPEGYDSEYGNVEAGYYTYTLDYIKGRGNSTWDTYKKPYKIKLQKKADLLGMGKQKHWVLLANYYDNSLLRNKSTYWLGEQINAQISDAYAFTPASVAVDVVMNGEYYGSYFLCEQVRVGDNRVEINDLEETPTETDASKITGGYLLSMEPFKTDVDQNMVINTAKGNSFLIESPEFEDTDINEAQVNYINDYVKSVENAIYGKDFKNSDGVRYDELMDVTSTAYYYLMQEFSMNGDGFISGSTYLYKTADSYDDEGNLVKGKLYWGPLWDFDYVAWGSTQYEELSTEGWSQTEKAWFARLLQDSTFADAVEEAWPVLKAQLESMIEDGGQLDQYYEQIKDSANYNFEYYGMSPLLGYDDETGEELRPTLTYQEEIERLKTWTRNRIDWIDENIDELAPDPCEVTFKIGDETIVQTESQGRTILEFPTVPEKENYTFTAWKISFHMTYEQFLENYGYTEENLADWFGEEEAEKIKENGYDSDPNTLFSSDEALPKVSKVTLTPYYEKNSDLVLPTKLYLGSPSYVLPYYETGFEIPVGYTPLNAETGIFKWTSSNPEVATVDSGSVTPVSAGTTTITVSYKDLSASCKVTILSDEDMENMDNFGLPEYSELNLTEKVMDLGSYTQVYIKNYPEGCLSDSKPEIISSDSDVVTVGEAGVLKATGTGTCTIIVQDDRNIMTCKITVVDPDLVANGDAFTSQGLNYMITSENDLTVEVTGATTKNITKLTIPATVKYKNKSFKVTNIRSKAFSAYTKLTSVTFGANVTSIGSRAFYGCTKLSKVTIGGKVTKIGARAFYGCTGLTNATIGNKVTGIGSMAFYKCTKLKKVTMGNKVTSIGSSAFYGCSKLTSVTLGKAVTSIGSSAFYKCSKLTKVTMGNKVTTIGSKAFYKCTGLKSVTMGSAVTGIGSSAFYGCSKLTKVTVGKKVATIGSKAFYKCTGLKTVTMGSAVTSIGSSAFYGCSKLTKVTIGKKVKYIGSKAFYKCAAIKKIYLKATSPKLYKTTFGSLKSTAKIYVPKKWTSYYKIFIKKAHVVGKY